MIMKECVPCRVPVRALVVIGLLALVFLPGWTLGQPPPDDTKPATPPPPVTGLVRPVTAPEVPPQVGSEEVVAFIEGSGQQGSDRLQEIEKQLQALLKEVQAMRKGGKGAGVSKSAAEPQGTRLILGGDGKISGGQITVERNPPQTSTVIGLSREGGEVTLTRATYNLSAAKGEALAALLKDVKNEVIETKVEGDKVTVTCSPEAQRLIAPFIALLNGQKGPRAYYQYVPRTTYQVEHAVPTTR